MEQAEFNKKIEKLISDEEYMKKLLSLGSAEEMAKELEKEDIAVTAEELRNIGALLKKKENGELSDEELENIAGGFCPLTIFLMCMGGATAIGGFIYGATKGIEAIYNKCNS